MNRLKHILLAVSLIAVCASAKAQADFEITPESACAGMTIKVKNTTGGNYQLAKFAFGDDLEAYGEELQHIYAKGGTYTVELTVLMDDGTWTAPKMRSILIGEKPSVEVSDNEKQGIITATVSDGASIKWYCNGAEMKSNASSFYYKESGEYKAVASMSNGCKDSASVSVTYTDISGRDITSIKVRNNVITPGVMDGINDGLAIEGLPFEANCEVQVFSKKGKLVYTNLKYTNTDGFVGRDDDGNDLPAGTYYYVIKSWGRKGCTGFVDIIR
ncbi:MAG: gliding motility-associated C-terminal domain-containing protein [Bacteroidales bacterium]|nr:gliding motility-associated C-terminal domain-containing protein [Bacteroidales bacterium]